MGELMTRSARAPFPPASRDLDLRRSGSARGSCRACRTAARGDAHALAVLAPAELDDAPRGVRDQRLGRLVAHRAGLDAPHQAAAPNGLAPRRERVYRHPGTVRGYEPRGAARAWGSRARRGRARGVAEVVRDRVRGVGLRAPHASRSALIRCDRLRLHRDSRHHRHGLDGMRATAVSCGEHHRVGAVEDRVGHVGDLRARRREVRVESICVAVIEGVREPSGELARSSARSARAQSASRCRDRPRHRRAVGRRRISSACSTAWLLHLGDQGQAGARARIHVRGCLHERTGPPCPRRSIPRGRAGGGPPPAAQAARPPAPGCSGPVWRRRRPADLDLDLHLVRRRAYIDDAQANRFVRQIEDRVRLYGVGAPPRM